MISTKDQQKSTIDQIKEENQLNNILAEELETARSKTVGRKEFTE